MKFAPKVLEKLNILDTMKEDHYGEFCQYLWNFEEPLERPVIFAWLPLYVQGKYHKQSFHFGLYL